jgi:hypothetical protein
MKNGVARRQNPFSYTGVAGTAMMIFVWEYINMMYKHTKRTFFSDNGARP